MIADLVLRPATHADRQLILHWRNDAGVRSTARTHHEISAQEHCAWFSGVMNDQARMILIAETGGRPVGQLRFDALGANEWEISISVDAAERGRGLGSRMIDAGVEWLKSRERRGLVIANVREDNERSRRAFVGRGFKPAGPGDAPGFERLVRCLGSS